MRGDLLSEAGGACSVCRLLTVGRRGERIKTSAGDSLKSFKISEKVVQPATYFQQTLFAIINGPAVMGGEQEKPDCFGLMALQHLGHHDLIALALGHLIVAGFHQAVVQPVTDEWDACIGFGLGQLVLVMGELQVEPAAVDVEGCAQNLHAHGRAFDVPARPAETPRAVPFRLARLGAFPEGKVARIALFIADFDASTGLQLLGVSMTKFAVIGIFRYLKVHIATDRVSKAFVNQTLDDSLDVLDVLSCSRKFVNPGDSELFEILLVVGGDFFGELLPIFFLLLRLIDDLVVDVGDVNDQGDFISEVSEISLDGIEDDGADHVADVAGFVDRRPADVHADFAGPDRLERLFLASERVVGT